MVLLLSYISPLTVTGQTICEPARYASHASLALKSKHPFQVALINSL